MPGGVGGDTLEAWAGRTGHRRAARRSHGGLRFAFYGRVSTEDWQDPVTSRARQRDQAAALVAGHGRIVAEFFDTGYSRTLAWARRPQAAALVAALADPDRGWDAIVIGEYERVSRTLRADGHDAPVRHHRQGPLTPSPEPGLEEHLVRRRKQN